MNNLTPQMPEAIELEEHSYSSTYGKFIVQPLERGFGVTLGNTFRRIILSSIQGAAITSIKIDGIHHEFSNIKGISEDVTDIILNLKQVQIKLLSKRPEKIYIKLEGEHEFTAADIQNASTVVEILNPEHHIATMNKNAKLDIEMTINRGRGYQPADENQISDAPLGTIAVDAHFSPVTNATFRVENTRVGHRTDYERLILEVWTNGSITPDDCLTWAGRVLREHVQLFINFDLQPEDVEEPIVDEHALEIKKLLKKPVEELELSVRAANCIKEAKIKTIKDLVSRSESDMLKFKNFGKKSLEALTRVLRAKGLDFGMDMQKFLGDEDEED
ncbi:DNA-directed RNA polymerase subunit alpha [bacterium]|nr:DNA-directed RNA polymerase subunit alpha [bacterium]